MDDRLSKSLDELVADRSKQSQRRRRPEATTGRAIRGTRNDRRAEPYDARHNPRAPAAIRREKQNNEGSYDCAIKFLLSHHFAGSVIGNGGFAMKDLIEITEADIHISNPSSPFPGSQERVLFITGTESSLFLASALIWEMIGQQTHSFVNGMALVWNPAAAKASPGEYDDQEVECRLAIPAACGGRILGRGGAVFRKMSSDHQVETKMSPVQEQEILQERIISIQGTVSGCMAFTAELLSKMLEVPEECKYAIQGTAYPRELVNQYLDMMGLPRGGDRERGDRDRDTSAGRRRGDDNHHSSTSNGRDREGRRSYNDYDDDSSNGGNYNNRNRGTFMHLAILTRFCSVYFILHHILPFLIVLCRKWSIGHVEQSLLSTWIAPQRPPHSWCANPLREVRDRSGRAQPFGRRHLGHPWLQDRRDHCTLRRAGAGLG